MSHRSTSENLNGILSLTPGPCPGEAGVGSVWGTFLRFADPRAVFGISLGHHREHRHPPHPPGRPPNRPTTRQTSSVGYHRHKKIRCGNLCPALPGIFLRPFFTRGGGLSTPSFPPVLELSAMTDPFGGSLGSLGNFSCADKLLPRGQRT